MVSCADSVRDLRVERSRLAEAEVAAGVADDQVIEDLGIAPGVFVPASAVDFMQGRDAVLDWALRRTRAN